MPTCASAVVRSRLRAERKRRVKAGKLLTCASLVVALRAER